MKYAINRRMMQQALATVTATVALLVTTSLGLAQCGGGGAAGGASGGGTGAAVAAPGTGSGAATGLAMAAGGSGMATTANATDIWAANARMQSQFGITNPTALFAQANQREAMNREFQAARIAAVRMRLREIGEFRRAMQARRDKELALASSSIR